MESKAQPTAKTYPPLKLAFCGEGDAAFTWWVPMLLQSPAFKVVAVWSRHQAEALRLHAAITRLPCTEAPGAGKTAATRTHVAGEPSPEKEAASLSAANGGWREAAGAAAAALVRDSAGREGKKERGEVETTRRTTVLVTGAAGAAASTTMKEDREQRGGGSEELAAAADDVEVYWEESGDLADVCSRSIKKSACKNFSTLLLHHSRRVEGFFFVLPPDSHAATAEQVLSHLPDKHIFSATPPTLHSPTMKRLISLYNPQRGLSTATHKIQSDACATQKLLKGTQNNHHCRLKNSGRNSSSKSDNRTHISSANKRSSSSNCDRRKGLWNVCCPFRSEVAVTKLQALMKDLGKLVTAELLASSAIQTVAHTYTGALPQPHVGIPHQQQRASLLAVCCAYSALLRLVLGDIVSLASVQGSASAVCGQLRFRNGVCCALTVDLSTKVTLFSLTVWGVKGFGNLCWNRQRNAFEIQRYLHHYEHPTLHPVTGPLWSVRTWIENVWRQERRREQLREKAEGGCTSGGNVGPRRHVINGNGGGDEEEDNVQAPEHFLVDLITSCALRDASGAVVQLR